MWPANRTAEYVIWSACIKLHIRPPGIPASWDEMTSWQQALAIAYYQTADYEDQKEQAAFFKAMAGR